MAWTRKQALIAGLALIGLTNAVAMIGVAYNRSGTPESELEFSQRELDMPYSYGWREDNGLVLGLRWRVQNSDNVGPPAWLGEAKLRELGFDLPPVEQHMAYSRLQSQEKSVHIVLELNGPAYRHGVEQARARVAREKAALEASPNSQEQRHKVQYAEDALKREENEQSRLIAVDAGRSPASLRAKYPDRTRYLILPGSVQPGYHSLQGKAQWGGYIHDMAGTSIHVALPFRRQLQVTTESPGQFSARVAFGQRYEPWLQSMHPAPASAGMPDAR